MIANQSTTGSCNLVQLGTPMPLYGANADMQWSKVILVTLISWLARQDTCSSHMMAL